MNENKKKEIVDTVVSTISTLWSNYKVSARRKNESGMETFINDLLNIQMTDAEAAVSLIEDIREVRSNMKSKKTKKEFDNIIKNSY